MQVATKGVEKRKFSEGLFVIYIKSTPLSEIRAVKPSEISEQVLVHDIVAQFHICELVELEFKGRTRLQLAFRILVELTRFDAIPW
jgi:hypothetical protein